MKPNKSAIAIMHGTKVGIMGASLGTANRGVSALAASLTKLVLETLPGAEPVMLIGNKDSEPYQLVIGGSRRTIPVTNYRLSPKSKLREHLFWITAMAFIYRLLPFTWCRLIIRRSCPWINTVATAGVVGDIRGGDSFSDIYGLRGFLLSSLPVITVIWVRGSIVLFPQTYGPYKYRLARWTARYILRRASVILSRDQEGMATVRNLIGSSEKIRFCPDVAFCLDSLPPIGPLIEPALPTKHSACLVGLNVNGLMFNGGYSRQNMFGLKLDYRAFLESLVATLLAQDSIHVLLVPHTFGPHDSVESDPAACRVVMQSIAPDLRHRLHLVMGEYDQHEIKGLVGGCDFFIGSRMHSCIAALSQGIPTVGVAYSKKFKGVFDSIGVGDWVLDGRENDAATGISFILQKVGHRTEMSAALAGRSAQAQALLRESFRRIMGECDG